MKDRERPSRNVQARKETSSYDHSIPYPSSLSIPSIPYTTTFPTLQYFLHYNIPHNSESLHFHIPRFSNPYASTFSILQFILYTNIPHSLVFLTFQHSLHFHYSEDSDIPHSLVFLVFLTFQNSLHFCTLHRSLHSNIPHTSVFLTLHILQQSPHSSIPCTLRFLTCYHSPLHWQFTRSGIPHT